MKAYRAFGCLFWALLYCVLYLDLTNASEDELLDFDFANTKDAAGAAVSFDDWLEDDEQSNKKLEDNMLDFSVDLDEPEPEKQLPPFDWREKVLRSALSKALTDRVLRQKFAEVMPILRVLSSQQRLALSALISAQMNAKQGHELRLEQVRMMFGNDKKLLLPIVYDLANLVKNSARKYIHLGNDVSVAALKKPELQQRKDELSQEEFEQDDMSVTDLKQPKLQQRKDELSQAESEQDDSVGTINVGEKAVDSTSSLEDFFVDMQSDLLDPQMINEALQPSLPSLPVLETSTTSRPTHVQRVRRSANEFVHKLPRSVPLSVTEQQLMGGIAGRTIRLNTTAFQQSSASSPTDSPTADTDTTIFPSSATQSYEDIENLAFAGLNGTESPLNLEDRVYQLSSGSNSSAEELLPSPEELIAGPHYRHKRPMQKFAPIKRKRVQSPPLHSGRGRPKTSASSHNPVVAPAQQKKCERFTNNMCIRTDDYPLEQIMGSIRRHKNAMSALLAEFYDRPNNNIEFGDDFDDYLLSKKRRDDEGSAGGMCQSVVRYARPQKAKAASGEWKFIVNTGQHTQTLRLEKCSTPGDSCSYLAQSYRSHCAQVYNYHRLLSWDKVRGLHVDIFKVPTCCSCQVDGYRQQFPPNSAIQSKDYSPAYNGNSNGYSTINEEDLDYNEASDEEDLGLSYVPYKTRDTNELTYLGSKKVRTKLPAPSSVGPYLSPPDDAEDHFDIGGYKSGNSKKKFYGQTSRRRPHNEPRVDVDLELSPSETHAEQEVNVFGPPLAGEQPRVPLKRKRIYTSTTHTANSAAVPAGAAAVAAGGGTTRLRIPISAAHPQTSASVYTTSSRLPARSGTAATNGGFHNTAYAHQAAAAPSQAATPNVALVQDQQRYHSASKSRPRYYAPPTTSPTVQTPASVAATPVSFADSAAATLPTTYVQPSTAAPQSPQLNSIYGEPAGSSSNGTRRINYSYHPIIDFFEKRRAELPDDTKHDESNESGQETRLVEQRYQLRVSSSLATPSAAVGAGAVPRGVYQHAIPTTHKRRMGFGGAGGGSVGYANDNAWQPLVGEHK